MEKNVIISNEDFERFIRFEQKYISMRQMLLSASSMGYDGKSLYFDSGIVSIAFQTIEPERFNDKLKELRSEAQ